MPVLISRLTGRKPIVYWGQYQIVLSCRVEHGGWWLRKGEGNKTSTELTGKFSALVKFNKYCLFCKHRVIGETVLQRETAFPRAHFSRLSESEPMGLSLQLRKIIFIYRQTVHSVRWRFRWLSFFSMEKASFYLLVNLFYHSLYKFVLVWLSLSMSYSICLVSLVWLK